MSETPVVDPPFVTPQALATFLKLGAVPEDPKELERLTEPLYAAIEWVESKVGPLDVAGRAYSVWADGRYLVLPVTHLTDVTEVKDPRGNVVSVAAHKMDLLAGIVEVPRACAGTWTVTASTREHRASVSLAVKIIASHLYEVHRGRGDGNPRTGMFAGGPEATAGPGPMGYAIPRRAADLLAPWLGA